MYFWKKIKYIYRPLSFLGKLSSDYGLLSEVKYSLEDLYLNIKQCILILLKNYTIWSHNLVLLLLKKRTLLSKIPAVSAHESKSSAAVPNFGRGFTHTATCYSFQLERGPAPLPPERRWKVSSQLTSTESGLNSLKTRQNALVNNLKGADLPRDTPF